MVVLNATFESNESASGIDKTSSSMKLTVNNVRKARGQARLGYVHPRHLARSISVSSIKIGTRFTLVKRSQSTFDKCVVSSSGGGTIFAVRFQVLATSPTMWKLAVKTHPQTHFTASKKEYEVVQRLRGKAMESIKESIERSPEVSAATVLDSMGCSEEVINAIMVSGVGVTWSRCSLILR